MTCSQNPTLAWTRPPFSLLLTAKLRRAQGRSDEALALFERVLELAPDDASAHVAYANTLLARAIRRGEGLAVELTDLEPSEREEVVERARAAFRRAIELAPDSPEAHTKLGYSYLMPGADAS